MGRLDLYGDGTLKQVDTDHQAPVGFLSNQYALERFERAAGNSDALALPQKRPRHCGDMGVDNGADGIDLLIRNRCRLVATANDGHYTEGCNNGSALTVVKTAKEVAGEERKFSGYYAVRPAASDAMNGKEGFIAFVAKDSGCDFLLI